MVEGRTVDTRTPPLTRRTGGGLKLSYSDGKTKSRGQGRFAQRRTRSEEAVASKDKAKVRELLRFPEERITNVRAARAVNSEPLRRIVNAEKSQLKYDVELPVDAVHTIKMYLPLDCITDKIPLMDSGGKCLRSTLSPTSPSLHPPLLPLAISRHPRASFVDSGMANCVSMDMLHITVDDKVHCQSMEADPSMVLACADCDAKAKLEEPEEMSVKKKMMLNKNDDQLLMNEKSLKKKRGRPSSKSSLSNNLPAKLQRTDVDTISLACESSSTSDKENEKQVKGNLDKGEAVKRGRPFKRKPPCIENDWKEEVRKRRTTENGFRKKLRSSHSSSIKDSSNVRNLRKRDVMDWSVLRKKSHTDAPSEVNNAIMTGDSTDLAVEAPTTAHPQENMKKKSLSVGMPSPENVVRQPKHKIRNAIMEGSTTPPKPKTMTGPVLLMSPTFVDSDLARPSRNVVRPVRLGDQLEQAEENLAIMRLPSSGSTQLPYEMDSLAWNKQHTANEQVGKYI